MKRAALVPPQGRPKVQQVSCPCCEAHLALHFLPGEGEVYDVELLGPALDTQEADGCLAGMKAAGNDGEVNAAAGRALSKEDDAFQAAAHVLKTPMPGIFLRVGDLGNEEIGNHKLMGSHPEQVRKEHHLPSIVRNDEEVPGALKLFPLFYKPKKTVHLVRHGHTHSLIGLEEPSDRFDLRLTSLGHQQARSIAPKMAIIKPELILVSPLTRTLQTLTGAFPAAQEPGKQRVEVTALHAEHVSCSGDVGRPPQILAVEYPWLSFDALPEVWWYSHPKYPNDALKLEFESAEPMEELRKRVGIFRQYLRSRPENLIVVIGHSTFFKELTSSRQRMRNCEVRTLVI